MYEYNKTNLTNAKELRKEMTPWERKLYYTFLKNQAGIKFYKQKLVGNYILDFYNGDHKLAIELDGSQHYNKEQIDYDEKRTQYLNSLGITVLRYTNLDIDKRFDIVCEDIWNHIHNIK